MIQEIICFPDERINIASADIRDFDETLWELIDDLKDTAEAHHAQGIAAIQIAIPRSVVIAKTPDGEWVECINPRIIKTKNRSLSPESTLYLPDVIEDIPRYEKITLIYQDRYGTQRSLNAEGEFARLLQRKIDYTFGGTLANRLDKKNRQRVEKKLFAQGINGQFNATSKISKREYFKSVISKLLFFEALTWLAPLFHASQERLLSFWHYDIFATAASIVLIIGYLIYSKFEADRSVSCTGCQVVSFTAVAVKYFLAMALFCTLSYLVVRPH